MLRNRLLVASFTVLALVYCGCNAGSPQSQLEQFIAQNKKMLPKTIDPNTTLIDLKSAPLEVIYVYKINGLTDEQVKEAQDTIKADVRSKLAANKASLAGLAKGKIKMTYVYQNQTGGELMRFTVNSWEL